MLFNLFKKPLVKEQFEAYFNRLPDSFDIDWRKDGDFIVANLKVNDGEEYTFQVISAEEFVEVMNNILFEANQIPYNYQKEISKLGRFTLTDEQFNELNDKAVKKSELKINKTCQLINQPA